MSTAIRPLAEIVSDLPFGTDNDTKRAGPSFEIYSDISLSSDLEVNNIIAQERFRSIIASIAEIGETVPRAAAVSDTVRLIARNLSLAFEGNQP